MSAADATDSVRALQEGHRRYRTSAGLAAAVLLAAAALLPAAAAAQTTEDPCTADVKAGAGQGAARFDVDCGNEKLDFVEIRTSENGSVQGKGGTRCTEQGSDQFRCPPPGESSSDVKGVSGTFEADDGDVCGQDQLAVSFRANFSDPERDAQTIRGVGVRGCSNDSGGSDSGPTPRGGVESGAGGTDRPAPAGSATLVPAAVGLAAALLAGGLFVRQFRAGA
jgi:hypothetical protein